MKKLLFILTIFYLLILTTMVSADTIIPGGYVSGTWAAAGSPYLVQGQIYIPTDSTLNIEAGAEVNFQGHYKLIIYGYLEALGTVTDSILFTAENTSIGWHSLRFIEAQDSSHLEYCVIEYGKANGTSSEDPDAWGGGIFCEGSSPVISHCSIRNNYAQWYDGGVSCNYSSNPVITYSTISDNTALQATGGIGVEYWSEPTISYCTISGNVSNSGNNVYFYYTNENASISHCTISNNFALTGYGGGVCFDNSSAVMSDCEITGNYAGENGGGILIRYANPTIESCTISENSANILGGGIDFTDSDPSITDCIIADNSAVYGGGISCSGSTNAIITNCTIVGNTASTTGGGIRMVSMCDPVITNCTIQGNTASTYGGGIWMGENSNPTITYCTIIENNATVWSGGGISCDGCLNPVVSNCDIMNNSAVFYGGGIRMSNNSNMTISKCTISGNTAGHNSGGIEINFGSNPTIENCTISGNESELEGGAMSIYEANAEVSNTIVYGNSGNGGVLFYSSLEARFEFCDFYNNESGNFVRDIPTGLGIITGVNANGDSCDDFLNIFEDPLFEDPMNGNYQITWESYPEPDSTKSPCIDAGDPLSPMDPDTTVADIGAFYFDQFPLGIVENPYSEIPTEYCLHNAYPNPFNPSTTISFDLPEAGRISLIVYNIQGREVATLVDGYQNAGTNEITFNAKDLVSGVYFMRMEAGGFNQVQKVVLMK